MTRTEEEGRKKMEPAGNWMGWSHSRFACHCATLCYSRYVELKHEWLSAMQSVDYVCNLDANERNCKNDVQNIRHKEKNCLPPFVSLPWSFCSFVYHQKRWKKHTLQRHSFKTWQQYVRCVNLNLKSSIHFCSIFSAFNLDFFSLDFSTFFQHQSNLHLLPRVFQKRNSLLQPFYFSIMTDAMSRNACTWI